jgi:hypothetical protein
LTYPQFKNAIEGVSKRFNWELKLNLVSVAPDALKAEDSPLFRKIEDEHRVFRMSDAQALLQRANS